MPIKYRDKVTGQVMEFDHEPSQQELEQSFQLPRGSAEPTLGMGPVRTAEDDKSAVAPGLLGGLGALIGGKTPLGKIGAGIGAAAGTGFGDLYNMFAHGVGDTTPSSEAQRLATVAGLTTAGEAVIPPVLRGIGAIKNILPKGGPMGVGGIAGYMMGHPAAGAAVGAGIEAAPKVADAIDWLGTPSGEAAADAARKASLEQAPAHLRTNPGIVSAADAAAAKARADAGGPLSEVPEYLQKQNWGSSIRSGFNSVKDAASGAYDELANMFSGKPTAPPAPPSPSAPTNVVRAPKSYADVAERTGVGGQYSSSLPSAARNPELRYNADIEVAPQRTPQLTQTSPTDPKVEWDELASRQNPRRAASGGQKFVAAEVDTPPGVLNSNEDNPISQAARAARAGLEQSAPIQVGPTTTVTGSGPASAVDDGLQRWIEAGGTPEGYARARGSL